MTKDNLGKAVSGLFNKLVDFDLVRLTQPDYLNYYGKNKTEIEAEKKEVFKN